MVRQLRSAIIGVGFMGAVHARAVRSAGGVMVGVAARTRAAAEAAADGLGAPRAFGSAEELATADDVDIVHICTPNSSHSDLAEMALSAGKHVICEKPLATSVQDARRLVELAASSPAVNAVPFVYRFYASVREARLRIARGDAGTIRLLHGTYLQDWLSRSQDDNWRVDPSLGGGSRAFGDIGVHWCDLVEFVSGHRISRLNANVFTIERDGVRSGRRTTEDAATVMFETDRGAMGSVVISQVSPGRKNRLWFSLDGSESSYQFDQELPDSLWIGGREQNIILPRASTAAIAPTRYDIVPSGHPQGYQDSFTAFVADVHTAIIDETPDGMPTFDDGLRAAMVTAAVLESADRQTWVTVPAYFPSALKLEKTCAAMESRTPEVAP